MDQDQQKPDGASSPVPDEQAGQFGQPMVITPQEQPTQTEATPVQPSAESGEASATQADSAVTTPTVQPAAVAAVGSMGVGSPQSGKKKSKRILVGAILGGVLLLGGGAVAAYVGIIVPNKPENLLKTALYNSAQEKSGAFDGKMSFESLDESSPVKAANVTFSGQSDTAKKVFETKFEITASGIKIPAEVRSIDRALYFKVDGLDTIAGFADLAGPGYGNLAKEVSKKVNGQWIEVDETLLKQAEMDCALNISYALTKEDADLLMNKYSEAPFATIVNTSKEQVNDQDATKFELSLDNKKLEEYVKKLDDLSVVKQLKQCDATKDSLESDESAAKDGEETTLHLWVSGKRVVKLATQSSPASEEREKMKGSLEVTFDYKAVDIQKPENAKPIMQLISELSPLMGGALGSSSSSASSQRCAQAYEDYANSRGTTVIPSDCESGSTSLLGAFTERL